MKLGKVEKLAIRDQWRNEEYDFTPWLAQEGNIQLLGEEINLDLEVDDIEVPIGSYKADIVARDGNNRTVIIENQLEKTDHKHLGQIITYASGVEAQIIIWVCSQVTDEHRQAIDWLNEVTRADIAFFGDVISNQVAGMAQEMGGGDGSASRGAAGTAGAAAATSNADRGHNTLGNYDNNGQED